MPKNLFLHLSVLGFASVAVGIFLLLSTLSFCLALFFIALAFMFAHELLIVWNETPLVLCYLSTAASHICAPIRALWEKIWGHMTQDGVISIVTYSCIGLCLAIDADATMKTQNALGACAWAILLTILFKETMHVRMQVIIAIAFATVGEHFASPYMGGYTYRFENVPAYIPPGHGMVYLTAVAMARSQFFITHFKTIRTLVLTVGIAWAIWGVTLAEQGDWVGFLLFCIFIVSVYIGKSPSVYLAAFFITTYLELVGTAYGTWCWAAIDPVLSLPQGNPPCGVAAWYCMVDAAALGGAPKMVTGLMHMKSWFMQRAYNA